MSYSQSAYAGSSAGGSYGNSSYSNSPSYSATASYSSSGSYQNQSMSYSQSPDFQPVSMQFEPESFLNSTRAETPIIEDSSQIMQWIKDAFEKTTSLSYPEDAIDLEICSERRFNELFALSGGRSSAGVMGFAINKFGSGRSKIAIRPQNLDSMMLTVGHEIGHCLSPSLPDLRDEEAKAFSFSIAWMNAIVNNNIAELSSHINPNPAKNGIHNTAWNFVVKCMDSGSRAIEVFSSLITGSLRIAEQPEVLYDS